MFHPPVGDRTEDASARVVFGAVDGAHRCPNS